MEPIVNILLWIVGITLALGIARQLSEQNFLYEFPDSFGKMFARHGTEGFVGAPADADLSDPRKPYSLLGLPPAKLDAKTLTAKGCYEKDFLAATEKVGNYIQRTNNFRHATPDNCTAPRTELVNRFYSLA